MYRHCLIEYMLTLRRAILSSADTEIKKDTEINKAQSIAFQEPIVCKGEKWANR